MAVNLLISDITDFDCLGIVKDEVIQTINNVNTKIKTEKVISINTDWPAMNVFDMFGGNKDTNTNDDIDSNVSKDANKKVKRKNGKNLHIMQVLPIFHIILLILR